jgi:hypothetical protein
MSSEIEFLYSLGYTTPVDADDQIYEVFEFRGLVIAGQLTDRDGFGHPMAESLINENIFIQPSKASSIPDVATHIVWYSS